MPAVSESPAPKPITSWRAAEANAAVWMRFWGFADAHVTEAGSDGGVDVRASGALAQVKREARPVGRPALQRLVGARGRDVSLHLLFFSSSGYSQAATQYAAELGIALYTYDGAGRVSVHNGPGRRLVEAGRTPVPTIDAPPPGTAVVPLWDPSEVNVHYFAATLGTVHSALLRMHKMASDPAVHPRATVKARKTTITPTWIREYAGLQSITAEVEYVRRGQSPVVSLTWSSYSAATNETLERVEADAEKAMERAHDLLVQLVGEPVARPT